VYDYDGLADKSDYGNCPEQSAAYLARQDLRRVGFEKDEMMRGVICKLVLAASLCILSYLPSGCSCQQLGETTAEGTSVSSQSPSDCGLTRQS
jgi:hypothetical protein